MYSANVMHNKRIFAYVANQLRKPMYAMCSLDDKTKFYVMLNVYHNFFRFPFFGKWSTLFFACFDIKPVLWCNHF